MAAHHKRDTHQLGRDLPCTLPFPVYSELCLNIPLHLHSVRWWCVRCPRDSGHRCPSGGAFAQLWRARAAPPVPSSLAARSPLMERWAKQQLTLWIQQAGERQLNTKYSENFSLEWLYKILKCWLNLLIGSKRFAARLQLRMGQYKQITRKAAWIPGREQLVVIFTCVSVIVEREGLVAVLTVAQWGQRDQTGVIFSLRGYHINGGLRSTTAVSEILRPLSLTHQAFDRRKDRNNDITRSHSPLAPSLLMKSLIDQSLIIQDNYSLVFSLDSRHHDGEFNKMYCTKHTECIMMHAHWSIFNESLVYIQHSCDWQLWITQIKIHRCEWPSRKAGDSGTSLTANVN